MFIVFGRIGRRQKMNLPERDCRLALSPLQTIRFHHPHVCILSSLLSLQCLGQKPSTQSVSIPISPEIKTNKLNSQTDFPPAKCLEKRPQRHIVIPLPQLPDRGRRGRTLWSRTGSLFADQQRLSTVENLSYLRLKPLKIVQIVIFPLKNNSMISDSQSSRLPGRPEPPEPYPSGSCSPSP